MRIETVRIENFRSFEDVTIPLNQYTCLVGPNGAGKSTVLTALNIFFRESENIQTDLHKLVSEDFHRKNTSIPIRITVTFCELNDEAKRDFSDYVRQGKLVITSEAEFDESTGKAEVKQYGQRMGMAELSQFFEAIKEGKKVSELKEIYSEIRSAFPDLPAPSTKDRMTTNLRSFEDERPQDCELIPSEDQFYGFSRGANRLAKHVQWVYVPAVKDATSEQIEVRNSALGELLGRTVRSKASFGETIEALRAEVQDQYQKILDGKQDVLKDLSSALQLRISEFSHPDTRVRLQWKQDDRSVRVDEPAAHVLVGEGEFEGELPRFGHGLQRSYLLALLQELAISDDSGNSTLILACEEPELYQHPPQARHLAAVLGSLSQGNAQVMVSTHDPAFVSGQGFEDVRMVRKQPDQGRTSVTNMSFNDIAEKIALVTGKTPLRPSGVLAKINQALQPTLNEMFFTQRLVLVEGLEDIAYIVTYLNLLEKADVFRRLGGHIVAVNGKSELLQPLVIAKHMKIPTYVMFDADSDKPDKNGSRTKHENDNKALLTLLNKNEQDPFPDSTCSEHGFTMWHSDIGNIVESEIGKCEWKDFRNQADNQYGNAGRMHKNSLHIGTSLTFAWQAGKQSPSLIQLCESILESDNYIS